MHHKPYPNYSPSLCDTIWRTTTLSGFSVIPLLSTMLFEWGKQALANIRTSPTTYPLTTTTTGCRDLCACRRNGDGAKPATLPEQHRSKFCVPVAKERAASLNGRAQIHTTRFHMQQQHSIPDVGARTHEKWVWCVGWMWCGSRRGALTTGTYRNAQNEIYKAPSPCIWYANAVLPRIICIRLFLYIQFISDDLGERSAHL